MFYGETIEKRTRNKAKQEEPSVLPKRQICANLSSCKYQVVFDVCESLGMRVVSSNEANMNCDLFWYDMSQANDILGRLKPY